MSVPHATPTGTTMHLSRRRILLALCALPLTTYLSGCLLDTTPTTPAPPTTTPTPRPTATPTSQPVRLALPTATRSDTPPPRIVPTTLPVTDPRGAGGLIYAGKFDGRAGVIAVRAGGGGSRLLTEGTYTQLAWSPDGDRIAAVGPLPGEPMTTQVALFTFNGRPLARYSLPGPVDRELLWSPDAQSLLCFAAASAAPLGGAIRFVPWVVSDTGARELRLPGERISSLRWLSRNRLAFAVLADGTTANPLAGRVPIALWTIEATGENARQVTQGAFRPIGFSPDEGTLYALADPELIDLGAPNVHTEATSLVAIDLRAGLRRTLARKATLIASASGDRQYWLAGGSISPNGARIAFSFNSAAPAGVAGTATFASSSLVIVGTAVGGAPLILPDSSLGTYPTWSPDSTKLASFLVATPTGENELRIIETVRGETLAYPLDAAYTATLANLAWSNDSRWLAYHGPRGLEIVATSGTQQTFPVAEDGVAPAWRPGGRA